MARVDRERSLQVFIGWRQLTSETVDLPPPLLTASCFDVVVQLTSRLRLPSSVLDRSGPVSSRSRVLLDWVVSVCTSLVGIAVSCCRACECDAPMPCTCIVW